MKKTVEEFIALIEHVSVDSVWATKEQVGYDEDGNEKRLAPHLGMIVGWAAKDIGFGDLTFTFEADEAYCDSEMMSREFVEAVLIKLARTVKLTDEHRNEDSNVEA